MAVVTFDLKEDVGREKKSVSARRQVDKGPVDGKVTLADLNES